MEEPATTPPERAADAPRRMPFVGFNDSSPGTTEQDRFSDALQESSQTTLFAASDSSSGDTTMNNDGSEALDTATLLTNAELLGRPELALASNAALDVALARLQEEYGAEITEDDLGCDVMADAVETAMTEAGELNLETVCERLSDATGISEWLIGEWLNGHEQQFSLPEEMAAGLMELRPGLVIKFSEFDSDREILELVAEASGVLSPAEIAWLTSD